MKTVFISSTFRDLEEHRRAVWQLLKKFDVAIRGMENFGARTEGPLDTCLAEVEQSDVYVGIVAFRLGSVHPASGKSFTQLEYEHARQLKKNILIYLADEHTPYEMRYDRIDLEPATVEKLQAFKRTLREQHTVNAFTNPEDLVEKLRRDLTRYLDLNKIPTGGREDEFRGSLAIVKRFLLTPKALVGREISLRMKFSFEPYPASRALCNAFNLVYGDTVGAGMNVLAPKSREMDKFTELYASGRTIPQFLELATQKEPVDVLAQLQFSEQDIDRKHARFFGFVEYPWDSEPYDASDPGVYLAPEGKVLMLFTKAVS